MDSCPINVFRLEKRGLERVLGSLEARIMETIWTLDKPVTVGEVQRTLREDRLLCFNTVMTVMNRLVDKGLLLKEGDVSPYLYAAVRDRHQFLHGLARSVAAGLVRDFGDYAIVEFFTVIMDENPEALNELDALLKKARESAGCRYPGAPL